MAESDAACLRVSEGEQRGHTHEPFLGQHADGAVAEDDGAAPARDRLDQIGGSIGAPDSSTVSGRTSRCPIALSLGALNAR